MLRSHHRAIGRRRLYVESLEARLVLANDLLAGYEVPSTTWFQTVVDSEANENQLAKRSVSLAETPTLVDAHRWLVRLSPAATRLAAAPQSAASFFSAEAGEFQVIAGLGLPGQLLIESRGMSVEQAESQLAENEHLAYYAAERVVTATATPNDPLFEEQLGLHQENVVPNADIDAPAAWGEPADWPTQTGSTEVVVAVLDSGVDYTHEDLYQNIWLNQAEIPADVRNTLTLEGVDTDGDGRFTFYEFNDPLNRNNANLNSLLADTNGNNRIDAEDLLHQDSLWLNGQDDDASGKIDDLIGYNFESSGQNNQPFDENGHGTRVAGIIGAQGNNGIGVAGLNWQTSIMVLKFLDENNQGMQSDAVQAINYLTLLRQQGVNIRVLNNSWGFSGVDQHLQDAITAAVASDILVVSGAGNGDFFRRPIDNDNPATAFYPASYQLAGNLSVTATDAADNLVPFFNFGAQSVHLAAPGLGILSTSPGDQYSFDSGTSFAAPFVSGTAALYAARAPADISAGELSLAIQQGVEVIDSHAGLTVSGGRLNAANSLAVDAYRPRASLATSPNVELAGETFYEFELQITDDKLVDVSTLDGLNVEVTRADDTLATPLTATLESDPGSNAAAVTARYRIVPPDGSWDQTDNGLYLVSLTADAIEDVADNAARPSPFEPNANRLLGSFSVNVPYPGELRVNSTLDAIDANEGDGLCATSTGECTLRAAVMEANADPADNSIVVPAGVYLLSIPGIQEGGSRTGDLDFTNDGTVLLLGADADVQPVNLNDGVVELGGSFDHGLTVTSSAFSATNVPNPETIVLPLLRTVNSPAGSQISEGDRFSITFDGRTKTFEFDSDANSEPNALPVAYEAGQSSSTVAATLLAAIRAAFADLPIQSLGENETQLVLGPSADLGVNIRTSALTLDRMVEDGDTISLEVAGKLEVFEFDSNEQLNNPQARSLSFQRSDTTNRIADAIVDTFTSQLTTVIDAAGIDRVIDIFPGTQIRIADLTIRGGRAPDSQTDGGGIRSFGDRLTLDNVIVRDNAAQFGGGLLIGDDTAPATNTITDSLFLGNTSSRSGGGIYNGDTSTLTVENTKVLENRSQQFGGGIISFGTLHLQADSLAKSLIADNAAAVSGSGSGGGLELSGPTTIDSTIIRDNVAVPGVILPDPLEVAEIPQENDTFESALNLFGGDQARFDLSIDQPHDDDYYRWTAAASGDLNVSIEFLHEFGDLDLELLDSSGAVLALGSSVTDNEGRTIPVAAGEEIFIRVFGFDGITHREYDLIIDGPTPATDPLEPNQSRSAAFNLFGGAQQHDNLEINPSGERDYFSWTSQFRSRVTIDLGFSHAAGDIDLALFEPDGSFLASSISSNNDEQIEYIASPGETIIIRVEGFDGATNSYTLGISESPENIPGGGINILRFDLEDTVPVTITNSVIEGNTAVAGGGINNGPGGKLLIEDTLIADNASVSAVGVLELFDVFAYPSGGGIQTFDELTVRRSVIRDNHAAVGGGIDNASHNEALVTIEESLITGNVAKQASYAGGGGIRNGITVEGGGELIVRDSTISNNFSAFEGGGITNGGNLTVTGSTLVGNIAGYGAGLGNWATAVVDNSTFSENRAIVLPEPLTGFGLSLPGGIGGAIYNIAIKTPLFNSFFQTVTEGDLTVLNSTIHNNFAADLGAAIAIDNSVASLGNTIVSGNELASSAFSDIHLFALERTVPFMGFSCSNAGPSTLNSTGHNLIGGITLQCSDDDQVNLSSGDVQGNVNPVLSPLQNNGGPTSKHVPLPPFTHVPLPGSPALDSGQLKGTATVDQRGITRPQDGNFNGIVTADRGAVERFFGEIQGFVFHDTLDDQIPLSGWTVYLDSNANGMYDDHAADELMEPEPLAVTDANGVYSLRLVEAGDHLIRTITQGTFEASNPSDGQVVTVRVGEVVNNVDFANQADDVGIQGTVFNDVNESGSQDESEVGIGNWSVFVDGNNNEEQVFTNASGSFEFAGLPPGTYIVQQGTSADYVRVGPIESNELSAPFNGLDPQSFETAGTVDYWDTSLAYEGLAGHTTGGLFYFGSGESADGGGHFPSNSAGMLTSPLIDLTGLSGKIELSFNHLLDVGPADRVAVSVLAGSNTVLLADNQVQGNLTATGESFETLKFDVSDFAGQEIYLQFAFESDTTEPRQEVLSADITANQEYFVQIAGFENSVASNYQLTASLPGNLADRFESNNTRTTATTLGRVDLRIEDNLSIHSADDDDFFRFTSAGSGVLEATIEFDDSLGDLDLFLLNSSGEVIDSGLSISNDERVSASVQADDIYFLQVVGFGAAVNPQYKLTINAPGVHPDALEENGNDTFATATVLPIGQADHRLENLTIDAPADDDYFRFVARDSGQHDISLAFAHAGGDLDLLVYDANQTLLDKSESATDNEQFELDLTAGQAYFVRVIGFGGAIQQQYGLTIDGPGIDPDALEDNEDFPAARLLDNFSQLTLSDLTLHLPSDQDFFRLLPTVGGQLDLTLQFDPTQSDADIFLYDANMQLIASSRQAGWAIDDIDVSALGYHEVTLTAGQVAQGLHFANQAKVIGISGEGGSTIQGIVYDDANGNRRRDDGEELLEGVTVRIDYDNDGDFDDQDTTEGDGIYSFDNLAPSTYTIEVVLPADAQSTSPLLNTFESNDRTTPFDPQAIAVDQLDSNDSPDIVVASTYSNIVTVYLTAADGSLPETGQQIMFPLNYGPGDVTIGHFDDQPGQDIVVVSFYRADVTLLSNDGNGNFPSQAPAPLIDLGEVATAIAQGDFNADGHLDLAITERAAIIDQRGTLHILLGNGLGDFNLAQSYPVGIDPQSITVGQFDTDDTLLDIAVASTGGASLNANLPPPAGSLTIFKNLGTSQAAFDQTDEIPTSNGSFYIASDDFDGMNGEDLVVANPVATSAAVSVYLNDGSGSFPLPTALFLTAPNPASVTTTDIDQDGDIDIVTGNRKIGADSPSVTVFRNPGMGAFESQGTTLGVAVLSGEPNFSITAKDFNGDQFPDLVVAKGGMASRVSLLTNFTQATPHSVRLETGVTRGGIDFGLLTASQTQVVARHAFFNNSSFDGNDPAANAADDAAIATTKLALLPGEQATGQNIVSYNLGLNGIMIDIVGLPTPLTLSLSDFEFHVGNNNDTANWDEVGQLPSLDIRAGQGDSGSDRISLIWPDGLIVGEWLEITVKSNENTGLSTADLFYFGNSPADTNGDGNVNATDFAGVRANPADFLNPSDVDSLFDLNRDGRVNGSDLGLVRKHATILQTRLNLIEPPPEAAPLQKTDSKATQTLVMPLADYSTTKRTKGEHAPATSDSLPEELFLTSTEEEVRIAALTLAAASHSLEALSTDLDFDQEQLELESLDQLFT